MTKEQLKPIFLNSGKYQHISENWDYTNKKLNSIREKLKNVFYSKDYSIVVAGSYGRMEASKESDFDYFILYDEVVVNIESINIKIHEILKEEGIDIPNPDGVFSKNYSVSELINKIGSHEDVLPKLGQRMLLLMESQSIYNSDYFEKVVKRILDKYLKLVKEDNKKDCVFLLNDLIRYFRSIAVNYEYTFWKENQKWTIRNIKLRHSRILIYSGILFLILESSKKTGDNESKYTFFEEHIFKTPLEKINKVYELNCDKKIDIIFEKYNFFLEQMNKPEVRKCLAKVEYIDRYQDESYKALKETSDCIIREVSRFTYDTKTNKWDSNIMNYLIF